MGRGEPGQRHFFGFACAPPPLGKNRVVGRLRGGEGAEMMLAFVKVRTFGAHHRYAAGAAYRY